MSIFRARRATWLLLIIVVGTAALIIPQAVETLRHSTAFMGDFIHTFYLAVHYWLNGQNPYWGDYFNAASGIVSPFYYPLWLVWLMLPIGIWPLESAITLWLSFNVLLLLVYVLLAQRWSSPPSAIFAALLSPWNLVALLLGQFDILLGLGVLLSYTGLKRRDDWVLAIGLMLMVMKVHLTLVPLLLAVLLLWREGMLKATTRNLLLLVAPTLLALYTWPLDVVRLTVERVVTGNPPIERPFYVLGEWVPSAGAIFGVLLVMLTLWRAPKHAFDRGLWSAAVTLSLIAAPHSFTYNWVLLVIPIAYLWRAWPYRAAVFIIYALPFTWLLLGTPAWLAQSWVLILCLGAVLWTWWRTGS